jgi:hypothetical protein
MNRSLVLVICAAMVFGLSGCSEDDETGPVTIHNTLDRLSRDSGFEFSQSHTRWHLAAARIVVDSPVDITEIMWSGVLDTLQSGADGIVDGTAQFEISIYSVQEMGIASDEPLYREVVLAEAEELPGDLGDVPNLASFTPHQFAYRGSPILSLPTGEYWVAVAGAGLRSYFYWAVEVDHVGVAIGSGGAVRSSRLGWRSAIEGIAPILARGYSLRVVGSRR